MEPTVLVSRTSPHLLLVSLWSREDAVLLLLFFAGQFTGFCPERWAPLLESVFSKHRQFATSPSQGWRQICFPTWYLCSSIICQHIIWGCPLLQIKYGRYRASSGGSSDVVDLISEIRTLSGVLPSGYLNQKLPKEHDCHFSLQGCYYSELPLKKFSNFIIRSS